MTTSYPSGFDSFTNPTGTDETDDEIGTRTHSEFHADVNDAIEAIEAELGTDPSGAAATVKARIEATETVANAALPTATATTTYQPLDSDLTAIAALTTTAYGRALLELANAAALRTAGGLVIGTDVAPVANPTFTGNVIVPDADAATKAMNQQASDARYAALTALGSVWFPASSMQATAGTTAEAVEDGWSYDQTAVEGAAIVVRLPAHWVTAKFEMWWYNAATGTGNVRWLPKLTTAGAGENLRAGTQVTGYNTSQTEAALSQYLLATATAATFTCVPGNQYFLRVERNGGSGLDTLANDSVLVGVNAVRVT